jgi:hypothetical protein
VFLETLLYHHLSMAASFENPQSQDHPSEQHLVQSLPCVVLLSPAGDTRARLEAVLKRPGLMPIFCDDTLSAMGEVARVSAGKGPASCVLLLDQPASLAGLDELFDALPKFVEVPIVWVFEPGPPVSLKDTPWDSVRSLVHAGRSAPALGNPTGAAAFTPVPSPAAIPITSKPSASEWVASSSETWSMPGLPAAGAKGRVQAIETSTASTPSPSLRLTGEPLPPIAKPSEGIAAAPVLASPSSASGFETPEDLAEATPQPKSTWIASSGQVLSDDELAMLLGPDGTPNDAGNNSSSDGSGGGFVSPGK